MGGLGLLKRSGLLVTASKMKIFRVGVRGCRVAPFLSASVKGRVNVHDGQVTSLCISRCRHL